MARKKSLLQKIWTELTRVRAIEFISYETEQEENERLAREFRQKVAQIRKANKDYVMEKLIAFVVAETLYRDNLLISNENARPEAEKMYQEAKMYGRLDELNRVCEVADV